MCNIFVFCRATLTGYMYAAVFSSPYPWRIFVKGIKTKSDFTTTVSMELRRLRAISQYKGLIFLYCYNKAILSSHGVDQILANDRAVTHKAVGNESRSNGSYERPIVTAMARCTMEGAGFPVVFRLSMLQYVSLCLWLSMLSMLTWLSMLQYVAQVHA